MKIFITGGSGFVGGAFIKAHAKNHELIAMSRSEKSDEAIKALGITPMRSSLNAVQEADLSGCDAVIHCAAYVEEWGPWATYELMNVEGTRQLLDVAKKAGVKRFVHIGTEAALFHGQHMRGIDETYPLCPQSPFPYSSTKAKAEKLVRDANDKASCFETIVLRPRMIWGPDDQTILAVVKSMAEAGKFVWVDGGKVITSTTHIDNLVHAMDLALTKGEGGESYFVLDDGEARIRDFFTAYLATEGVELGTKSVPGWFLRGLSNMVEPIWRTLKLKSEPPITKFTAHIMSRDGTFTDEKARTGLGYAPVISREDGLSALSDI
jgi:nucleoside-diphosphate-sugar epimerase